MGNNKNTGKADKKASNAKSATGSQKAAGTKIPAAPKKKTRVKKVAAEMPAKKTAPVEVNHNISNVEPGTIISLDINEVIAKVKKGFSANEKIWTKKFDLPTTSEEDAVVTLVNKIRYGKISLNEL